MLPFLDFQRTRGARSVLRVGVDWDGRYEALRPVWEERFGALQE